MALNRLFTTMMVLVAAVEFPWLTKLRNGVVESLDGVLIIRFKMPIDFFASIMSQVTRSTYLALAEVPILFVV